jgi:stage V sporulation protein AE
MELCLMLKEVFGAFVVGGGLCLIGQLLFDVCRLTPAHTMSLLVVAGSVFGALGWYQPLAELGGMGGSLPIVSFGATLAKGAMAGAAHKGFWGIWLGMLQDVSAGISVTVFMALLVALLFKPQS